MFAEGAHADRRMWIGGERIGAGERAARPVMDPARGKEIGAAPVATPRNLDDALDASRRGFEVWR